MSTKTDYVDEEWMHLRRSPFVVAAAITIADPGGPIEMATKSNPTKAPPVPALARKNSVKPSGATPMIVYGTLPT